MALGGPPGDRRRVLAVACARLGFHGEIGIVVAGCERPDFPVQTERLLIDVATNQAAVGLEEARLLSEQKREESLEDSLGVGGGVRSERDSRLIVDNIPGMVALLTPTGDVCR